MINFHIMTLFPDMFDPVINTSITGRAVRNGLISVSAVDFRQYTNEKHGHVDDAPFGGGAGMVIMCQPVYDAWKAVLDGIKAAGRKKPRVIYTSPGGMVFDQKMAKELACEEDLVILCGHYEGVDQRILDIMDAEEVSIGDYILTGGELPAMVMIDAVSRMVPGVLGNEDSGEDESFSTVYPEREFTRKVRKQVYGDLLTERKKNEESLIPGERAIQLLEYPQYTRPEVFMGLKVPEILLSGDHAKVDAWRREQSVIKTKKIRPDLLK